MSRHAADRTYRLRWATLGVLCLSLLLIGLDTTVLNVALPTLARELSADSGELQWTVDAYTLVFAGLLLTCGSLGDRFGRKRALALGLVIFAGASAAGAFVSTPDALIAARAVQGVGGALIMPSTLSILTNTFIEPRERARAIGIWAGVSSMGVAFGPALGGWLLDHFWWGSVLLINTPIAVVALVLGFFLITESRDASKPKQDLPGAALSIAGLVALVWGIIEAPGRGWTDTWVLAAFGAGVVLLALFVAWELYVDTPMLDLRFFRNPRFSAAATCVTLVFFGLFGSLFFLAMYLQGVLGYDPLETGLRLIPMAIGLGAGAPLATWLSARAGEKIPAALGLLILAVALGVMATTGVDSGYGRLLLVLILAGGGMTMAIVPTTEAVMGALPRAKAGVGSAVNDTTRQVGGALGVAVLGSVLHSLYSTRMSDHVAGLPAQAAKAVKDNIIGATEIAARLGPRAGALVDHAQHAFVHAMDVTLLVGTGTAVLGALVVIIWLPHRGVDMDAVPAEDVRDRTGARG